MVLNWASDPSPVPFRLEKAPEQDTLSPRERAVPSLLHPLSPREKALPSLLHPRCLAEDVRHAYLQGRRLFRDSL